MARTASQLEAKTLQLVDSILNGNMIEDDLVECKSSWPGKDKARQLAGLANQAHGSEILLIVGLDEATSTIVPLDSTDPTDWWATLSSAFDEGIAPMLIRHLRVPINSTDSVVALLFETDRAPYLVKNLKCGSPEFEIPIRVATGTRSAHRSEVIRMLTPAINLPNVVILSASLTCQMRPEEAGNRLPSCG